jgi:hypothetical protein
MMVNGLPVTPPSTILTVTTLTARGGPGTTQSGDPHPARSRHVVGLALQVARSSMICHPRQLHASYLQPRARNCKTLL